ncbi:phage tail sheath C-terminal domain-containing protein [Mesorhizobium sp. M1348]|uniref:DUF2586 family protein n=1 Tax=unclassified Mesorhizobium TaxID=325217 RepID=UPI00333CDC0B
MPSALTYPGVYIEEIPSGVRTIVGVGTSIAAFVGRAERGPVNKPIAINSYGDFERRFGGLWKDSTLGYAVRDFYLNGGSQAVIVRLFGHDADQTKEKTKVIVDNLTLVAVDEGKWGKNLRAEIDLDVTQAGADSLNLPLEDLFNLTVRDSNSGEVEQFRNLTLTDTPRKIDGVLASGSALVRCPSVPESLSKIKPLRESQKALADAKKKLATVEGAKPQVKKDIDDARTAVSDAEKALNTALLNLADPMTKAEKQLAVAKNANKKTEDEEKKLKDAFTALDGSDGLFLKEAEFIGDGNQAGKKGLYALDDADLFNILCIPPYTSGDVDTSVISAAAQYCERRRAMFLIDPRSGWNSKESAIAGVTDIGTNSKNAALFFPRLKQPDPMLGGQVRDFVPSGAVAGIFARTDTTRGVWKAPAGFEATLVGVPQLSVPLTDGENGELNPLGINCLRSMPAAGRIVWGSRTLQGDDRLASEWKYIPVRRTALFIEESLYRGTHWVVFEPNDEPLWAQIRLNVGAFMNDLFRQGAFQGQTPREAYFVKCDKETTTQNDIDKGIVNILVGFAPLKPAEFVVVKLQQIAGDIQT